MVDDGKFMMHQTCAPIAKKQASFLYKKLKIKPVWANVLRIIFKQKFYGYTGSKAIHQRIKNLLVRKPANSNTNTGLCLDQMPGDMSGNFRKTDTGL